MPGVVLGRDEHRAQPDRPAVLVVEGDLGLAVGAQVRDDVGPAHLGQALGHAVGQPDRQRHQRVGLVAGVAEHHPLVAGALRVEQVLAALARPHLLRGVDALADVGALLVEGDDDAAGVAVEAEALPVVADGLDRLPGDRRDVDVLAGRHLARDDAQAGGQEGLAGHPAARVGGQDGVEDRVGDLVGDLVGMALGDRFRGEGPAAHVCSCWLVCGAGAPGVAPSARTTASRTAPATTRLSASGTFCTTPAASDDGHLVGVVLEADARRRDVVGHDQVEVLAPELALRVGHDVVGLGREADQHLPGPGAPAQLGQDVGGGLEDDLGRSGVLLDLAGGPGGGPEVGHRGGHDDDVGLVRPVQHGLGHLGRRLDGHDLGPRRAGAGPTVVTSVVLAPRRTASAATA